MIVAASERVAQEVKRSVREPASRVFVSFTVNFSFDIMDPHRRHCLFGFGATADHEVIRIVDDVSAEPLLMSSVFQPSINRLM